MSSIKALLFGLDYQNTSHALSGCINDVYLAENFLTQFIGVNKSNISSMTDVTEIKPTRENMLSAMNSAIDSVNKNNNLKTLWIHYSGHGTRTWDRDGDENKLVDDSSYGKDEALCTLDNKLILDDELNKMFSKLNADKNLVCVFDCCHSGTLMDLPYRYCYNKNANIKDNQNCQIKCKAILLSGAKDTEYGSDAYELSEVYSCTGAFTTSFLKKCKESDALTIDSIMEESDKYLKNNGFTQTPQVSANFKLNTSSIFLKSKKYLQNMKNLSKYRRYVKILDYWYRITKRSVYKRYRDFYQKKINNILRV